MVMYTIKMTKQFNLWLSTLKDKKSTTRIMARLYRVEQGNFGDHKMITGELSELRFFFSSGYRIYYTIKNNEIVLLLQGGDKSTQNKDIKKALVMIDSLNEEH